MDGIIDKIFIWLNETVPDIRIAILIIAMLPIVEARLAVPIALKSGLLPASAWLYSFLGSSIMAPFLLLLLLPLINALSRTKLFNKAGDYLMSRFSKKAEKIESKGMKAFLGVLFFVALPLPLTGVWTGCAIAAILKMNYFKALSAVVLGNLIASGIMALLCVFLEPYINTIILIITLIAVAAVVLIIVKILLSGKKKTAE